MLPPICRQLEDDPPIYRDNTDNFTVEIHYRVIFYDKPNILAYEGRVVLFFDFLYPAWFTRDNLTLFLRSLGMDVLLDFYYRRPRITLGQELRRLESEDDVRQMLINRGESIELQPATHDGQVDEVGVETHDEHISVEKEEVGVETHDDEEITVEEGSLLVESDYKME
ncbi:hypothetical protein Adt_13380 [Abeliophyllum distichum]|uniref:Uncharacterized protein n=1 Tax=Abeliophyllum distichum TaxID=126358 RepID=A0ABD1TX40_9LAMI